MKIAIVLPYIHEGGGVPAVARYLCQVLSEHECQLISLSTSARDRLSVRLLSPKTWLRGIQIQRSTWEGHSVIDVGANLTELEFQRYLPRHKLTELLNQYDLVQFVAGTPAVAYSAKHVKVPVFLQVATLVQEERKQMIADSKGLKKIYLQVFTAITHEIEKRALKRADLVFVENFWMQKHLEKALGSDKVVMAPPGVDAQLFKPASKDATNANTKYIISVGRFNDRRKNAGLLFKAYFQLRQRHPSPPRLILAGLNGPTAEDWLLAEQLGIKQFVDMKLNISKPELVAYLQHAELFVCSSDEEGLGIAMLEALACGIPVVSTRCGGPETFMQEGINGYLVEKDSAEQLADRINTLLINEPLKVQMGKSAREIIELKFSNEATGKLFTDSYAKYVKAIKVENTNAH